MIHGQIYFINHIQKNNMVIIIANMCQEKSS